MKLMVVMLISAASLYVTVSAAANDAKQPRYGVVTVTEQWDVPVAAKPSVAHKKAAVANPAKNVAALTVQDKQARPRLHDQGVWAVNTDLSN